MSSLIILRNIHRASLQLPTSQAHTLHTASSLSRPATGKNQPKETTPSHTAENYFKDVDESPPADPTLHRVDAASEAAQRPYEPPSGEWSRAGMQTEEYTNVDREHPYDVPGNGASTSDEKLRYGGKERYADEIGPEMSQADEGGEKAKGGRK